MPGLFAGTPLERPVTCERCGQPLSTCACPRDASGKIMLPRHQNARVRREKRRGKFETVVAGLDERATDLAGLLNELRASLGTGGTVSEGEIEIQGDHRDTVLRLLTSRGYAAKLAGG